MSFPTTPIIDNFTRANENPLANAAGGTSNPSFPSTGIADNFNRANENPLSGGGNWGSTKVSLSATQMLELVSNQCAVIDTTSGRNSSWWNFIVGPDCEVYVDILATVSGNMGFYLYTRLQNENSANLDGYFANFLNNSGAPNHSMWKEVNNVATQIGSNVSGALVAGDTYGLSSIGNSHVVYRKTSGVWSTIQTFSDSAWAGVSGHIGIGAIAVGVATATFDNFGGGTTNPQWSIPMSSNYNDTSLKVVSNQCVPQSISTLTSAYWNPTTFGPDCEVYITAPTVPGAGFANLLYLRCASEPTTNGYYFWGNNGASSGFFKLAANVATRLSTVTQTVNAGDTVGASAVGTTLTSYQKSSGTWSTVQAQTDATYGSAGNIGFGCSAGNPTAWVFTNFGGGTFVPPPAVDVITEANVFSIYAY